MINISEASRTLTKIEALTAALDPLPQSQWMES